MVKHLPPAVKHLMSLRNPNPLPMPSSAAVSRALDRTFKEATQRGAARGWLVLSTCTFLTANCPPAVGYLYRFATRSNVEDPASREPTSAATTKAAIMRESAFKSAIFTGVPRSILSLAAMNEAFEDDVRRNLRTESVRIVNGGTIDEIMARGRSLWDSIYEPHADKLYGKLNSNHPDFMSFVIPAYGAVLAPLPDGEKVEGNLSRTLGSVVGSACLRAESGVAPQLISHVFGLLKARNTEGQSEEDKWLSTDEGTEWVISTVDTLMEVFESEVPDERAKL